MISTVTIGGKECRLVSSGLTPRAYRFHFGSDFFRDAKRFRDKYDAGEDYSFEFLENMVWLMLKHGGNDVGESIDDWLPTIEVSDLYGCAEAVGRHLAADFQTSAKSKKK